MNTARLKLLTWTAAAALGVGLVAYVGTFLRQRDQLLAPVAEDRMAKVLKDVPEPPARIENIVDREKFEAALRKLDWTGKPPPKPVDVVEAPVPVDTGPEPVDKFVRLRAIKIDAATPENGEVIFKYMADARVTTPAATATEGTVRKHVGQPLDSPLEYIHVVSITDAGVEFGFDDAQRAHEFLTVNDYPLSTGYVIVGDDILQVPVERSGIPAGTRTRGPQPKTERISPNKFRIGYEDAKYIDENYTEILSKEVTYGRHRDPRTGEYDGIEIKSVKPDSIASQHGVQAGDVIKSINGHPVSSTSEALQFVKTHKDQYDFWEVEISNRGQTRTQTYYPPQN